MLVSWLGAASAAEPPPVAAPGYRPQVETHELWVLELHLGGQVLHPGLLAIDREGHLLLPIGELAAAFELAIEVDPHAARAAGWLIHPRRAFELDLGLGELRVEQGERDFYDAHIIVWSEDIYVDARALSSWWPVDVRVDRRRLRIDATPREELPVERRLARERLHQRLGMRRRDGGRGADERGYAWSGTPALDVHLRSRTSRTEAVGRDWESSFDVATAGDLLRMHTETLWTGVQGEYTRLRARAGRSDPEGEMGGPLRLREFTLGDVSTPSLPFLSQARGGRGLQLSSFPLDHQGELGQVSFDGDLRPGWEVELFRGDLLLDFRASSSDLRYRFEDVPTMPGLNVFRLVFHGPRGELREEERRVWMDGGLARPGETRFRLTLNQHDEDLLTTGDIGGSGRLRGEPRAFGEVEHGLGDSLTVALAGASLPLFGGQQHYASLGARAQLFGSLLRADLLGERDGGWGSGLGWQTRLGRMSLGLSHHEFRDFLSERTLPWGGERVLRRSAASLGGPIRTPLPVSYRVEVGQSHLTGGRFDTDGSLRVSTFLRPVALTHTLRGVSVRGDGADDRFVTGDLLASVRRGDFGLRGAFAYVADPGDLTSISAIGDWTPHPLTATRLGVAHAFGARTSVLASLSRRIGVFVVSADAEIDDRGALQGGVTLSFGLGPDPFGSGYRWQEPGATRTGSVGARVFLDRDANGRFDPGDEPLPDIGFWARGDRDARSAADGTAHLTELPAGRPVDVAIDDDTIEDPHWVLPKPSERVVLRPGAPLRIDFPVVPVGEIDGWVRVARRGGVRALPGVTVQLLDDAGEVVATARSQVDGFYLFQEVVSGRYRVRVDPEHAARLGLLAPDAREVVLSGAGDIASHDLLLHEPTIRSAR